MPKRRSPGGRQPVPQYRPQLARLVKRPPDGDEWLHEMKYDGYRIGCRIVDGETRLITRNGNDWTDAFPEIVDAIGALGVRSALLDGEVAMVLPDGRTSFQALQNAFRGGSRRALVYFVFTQPPWRPGSYGRSRRLEMIPSSPTRHACSKKASPVPSTCSE